MSTGPVMSVCVPTFNRPDMVEQLIASFRHQRYESKELIISDDSSNDETASLVTRLGDTRVRYFRNETNQGYSRNFRLALERASGDILVTLGDDDAFLSVDALAVYARVFNDHETVGYAYANFAQFNSKLQIEHLSRIFSHRGLFTAGEDALRNIWTTSVFIPGMAFRRDGLDLSDYPTRDMLFPQVQLVGHVLARRDGYGISEFLIAGRAHEDQLGFHAIRGNRIKAEEKHGNIEFFDIFDVLRREHDLDLTADFLSERLTRGYVTAIMKERMLVGRRRVLKNYQNFVARRPEVGASKSLKVSLAFTLMCPRIAVVAIRALTIAIRRRRSVGVIASLELQLREMVL